MSKLLTRPISTGDVAQLANIYEMRAACEYDDAWKLPVRTEKQREKMTTQLGHAQHLKDIESCLRELLDVRNARTRAALKLREPATAYEGV